MLARRPCHCAARRRHRGGGADSRAIAALGLGPGIVACSSRRRPPAATWGTPADDVLPEGTKAERSDGPRGPRVRSHPCARAEERSGMGGARALQAARSAAEGRGDRGRPFFGYFLSAKRKKVTALPGAHPGLRPLQENKSSLEPSCLHDVPERGGRPRTATYFLLSRQEKVGKEKATPVPATPAAWRRQGQPVLLAAWAHCTTRIVRCAHSPRTGAMSQSTKRTTSCAAHATALLGAGTGVDAGAGPSRAIAALGLGPGFVACS